MSATTPLESIEDALQETENHVLRIDTPGLPEITLDADFSHGVCVLNSTSPEFSCPPGLQYHFSPPVYIMLFADMTSFLLVQGLGGIAPYWRVYYFSAGIPGTFYLANKNDSINSPIGTYGPASVNLSGGILPDNVTIT